MKTNLRKFNEGDTVLCTWGSNKGEEFIVRYAHNDGYVLEREGSEKEYYYAERMLELKLVIGKRYIVEFDGYKESETCRGVYRGNTFGLSDTALLFEDSEQGAAYVGYEDIIKITEE